MLLSISVLCEDITFEEFQKNNIDSIIFEFIEDSFHQGYRRFNFWDTGCVSIEALDLAKGFGYKCFSYFPDNSQQIKQVSSSKRTVDNLVRETNRILSIGYSWDFPYADIIKSANTYCKIYNYTEKKFYN